MTAADTPEWLLVMRAMNGLTETAGSGDNPKILAMRDEIARRYSDMAAYAALYTHDATPWCGLAVAYCMNSVATGNLAMTEAAANSPTT